MRLDLAPVTVFAGIVAAFGGLSFLGWHAAHQDYFPGFVRFMRWTAPDTKFYPTVGEMMSIVRTRAKRDQILVIVGGNSVLRGVGQPVDRVWTKTLQQNLGPGYAVVNLAFNGSGITDGGAVVAEALRKEYPRQIYIANAAPTQPPAPDGTGVYRFVFWEARAKGLLIDDATRNEAIVVSNRNPQIRNPPPGGGEGLDELRMREWLDHLFYFQDFWNKVTYLNFNAVWGAYSPGPTEFLRPRQTYSDPEPDRTKYSLAERYIPANLEVEMINVIGCSQYAYGVVDATGFHEQKSPSGQWTLYAPTWDQFTAGIKGAMPPELKGRTLVLMSRNSPFYIQKLKPDEQERDNLAYLHAVEMWKAGGYDSIDYGKDFTVDDYGDRTHLTWRGGDKLAVLVAAKIHEMSAKLGYLSP